MLAAGAVLLAAAPRGLKFEFDRYNDTYTGVATEFNSVQVGPVTVKLSSDEHDVTVMANRLEVGPAAEGLHRAEVWARFHGRGNLTGEILIGAIPARLEDRVTVVEQERAVEATIRIDPDPSGYLITLEELPATLEVQIESDLAKQLVDLCRSMSFLIAGETACDQLGKVMTHPDVPLPEPGTQFVVRYDLLTAAEREQVDGYLRSTDTAPAR